MGSIFKPKIPAPPAIQAPPEPDFSYEDEARKQEAEDDERRRNLLIVKAEDQQFLLELD